MGKGKQLDEKEKGKIDQLLSLGWNQSWISKEIGRSRKIIQTYIKQGDFYGQTPRSGRPKALGKRSVNQIFKLASNKSTSCRRIANTLAKKVSRGTILNVLKRSKNFKYKKMQGKPPLTENHKNDRFNFALDHVRWTTEWNNVVFSDEKKFNFDGPDGLQYYWHDLRKGDVTFSKRVQGGGSVMVWIGFCSTGKTIIKFVSTRLNSEKYIELLDEVLIPFAREEFGSSYTFQQDNAPCHRAKKTQEWLARKGINLMKWPSRSPDLNPVENLWGILVRKVYEGGKQFSSLSELKTAILLSWYEIETDSLKALVDSMPNRMDEVLKEKGGSINY